MEDPHVKVIALNIEGIAKGSGFQEAVIEAAKKKPVVILKPDRTAKGQVAVASHTKSLAGNDALFSVFCKKYGIIRANDITEMYDCCKLAAMLPCLPNNKLLIMTSSGGSGILATDTADENGVDIMPLSETAKGPLRDTLHSQCVISNPLDLTGDITAGDEIRMAHLPIIKPEMATFDCGTMNWGYSEIMYNSPDFLRKLGKLDQELGIKPEVEIFDFGMMDQAVNYIKEGILQKPVHFQLIFGTKGGVQYDPEMMWAMVRRVPEGCTWSAFGVGRYHVPVMTQALLWGGGARVGLEDNIYYSHGVKAESNTQLVERAVRLAKELQRDVATSDDVREMFKANMKNHYMGKEN